MTTIEHGREEHEREFDGFGDPGQKRGQAQRQEQARDAGAALRSSRVIHGEACPRQPEHHDGKEARHERAGGRIAGEESLQVAGGAVVVADDEPREIIEDVMQPGDDQYSVQGAVCEQTQRPRAQNGVAGGVHSTLQKRPGIAQHRGQSQSRKAADDGHEAPATEKTEVARQGNVAEPVIAEPGDDSGQQSDRDAEFCQSARRRRQQSFDAVRGHQKSDESRKPGRTVILARQAHPDADRKQQPEIRKNRVSGRRHRRPTEHVGLSQAQQEAGDRQHRDGQHQRPAQLL
jgi:hypothetical protein